MIERKIKTEIDNMSYEQLLSRWRFAPCGDFIFQGENGDYYKTVMKNKKESLSSGQQVAVSKKIG